MSDLLSIGVSGARTAQTALSTVSENIANAGVAGYSRRRVVTEEVAATAAPGLTGYGVRVTAIQRSADQFKAQAVRTAGADLSRTTTASEWLTAIQSAMSGPDVGARVTDFFNKTTKLAADPSSLASRSAMLESAASVAGGFTTVRNSLAQITADIDAAADSATASLTRLSDGLARTNTGLARAVPGSAGAVALLDERDRLLEEMSGIADISASFDQFGRVNAKLGGPSGPVLVAGDLGGEVGYARTAEGSVSFVVTRGFTPAIFSPNAGTLAGLADAAEKVAGARGRLDEIAKGFADGVNAAQLAGKDLDQAPGVEMFAYDADEPSRMQMVLDSPNKIAASSPTGGRTDASNLAAFSTARTEAGTEKKMTALVADNAAAIETRKTVAAAQNAILDGAMSDRDSLSGVNIDTEAVDLLRYQQAFQASSRVIQAARDIFQSILEIR